MPRELFWTFIEDMDLFSEDSQKMAPQMAKGILTNAIFQSLMEECSNEGVLATRMSEHAAQVSFLAFWDLAKFPKFFPISNPHSAFAFAALGI